MANCARCSGTTSGFGFLCAACEKTVREATVGAAIARWGKAMVAAPSPSPTRDLAGAVARFYARVTHAELAEVKALRFVDEDEGDEGDESPPCPEALDGRACVRAEAHRAPEPPPALTFEAFAALATEEARAVNPAIGVVVDRTVVGNLGAYFAVWMRLAGIEQSVPVAASLSSASARDVARRLALDLCKSVGCAYRGDALARPKRAAP